MRQIEQARAASVRIRAGDACADVAHDLGYFDQPHLARSLTRFVGHTATALRTGAAGQLSLLYKTGSPGAPRVLDDEPTITGGQVRKVVLAMMITLTDGWTIPTRG